MAKQSTISAAISEDFGTLSLSFDNGEALRLHVSQLGVNVAAQALMHGLKQKLVDAAAISRNTETGRSATTEDKYNAVREVYDRLLAGQWNKGREAGTGATGSGGLLLRALGRLYPQRSPEKIRAYFDGLDDAKRAALRKHGPIAAHIEDIKAEDAARRGKGVGAGGVDVDSLLAGLDDEVDSDE